MHHRKQRRGQGGFTLIEIMVVVVIIGLLVGIVGPNVYRALFQAEEDTALVQVKQISAAVGMYYIDNHRIPSMEDLMEEDGDKPSYLTDGFANADPWGGEYEIREGDRRGDWVVLCAGEDGSFDTEDDISSKDSKNKRKDG